MTEKTDLRVLRTRRLLQEALNDLLATTEFRDITVQDITQRAAVNRATFYAHFTDKYDLLRYSVRESFQSRWRGHTTDQAEFSDANLRLLIAVTWELLADFNGHCKPNPPGPQSDDALVIAEVRTQLYHVLLGWLQSADRTGEPPEVVATLASWTIFGAIFEWTRPGQRVSPSTAAEQILAFIETALRPYITLATA